MQINCGISAAPLFEVSTDSSLDLEPVNRTLQNMYVASSYADILPLWANPNLGSPICLLHQLADNYLKSRLSFFIFNLIFLMVLRMSAKNAVVSAEVHEGSAVVSFETKVHIFGPLLRYCLALVHNHIIVFVFFRTEDEYHEVKQSVLQCYLLRLLFRQMLHCLILQHLLHLLFHAIAPAKNSDSEKGFLKKEICVPR